MKPVADPRSLPDVYLPEPAVLEDVRPLTRNETYFRLRLHRPRDLGYLPGQFMEISVPGIGECPISICSAPDRQAADVFELVVRNVGNVTRALHALEPGDRVGVRGPFGTHFPVDGAMLQQDVLFICGGIGLVPVRPAIHYVLSHREQYGEVSILIGTRSPQDRLFIEEVHAWKSRKDVDCRETVDVADPSWGGHVGVITALMPRLKLNPSRTVAVVCGPPIMYKFVLLELEKQRIAPHRVYVSLERHMRCGVGKCGHCQINGLYACQEGPVFKYADILTLREAI